MKYSHKLAVLVSGSGTLLEHMTTEHLPIGLVIAEKPCRGLEVAKSAKYQTELLPRINFGWNNSRKWSDQPGFDRVKFSIAIADTLNDHGITITAMAGFMTILSPSFFRDLQRYTAKHPPSATAKV